jgi:hypothetical protein
VKVLLIDVDSQIPNLALMKVSNHIKKELGGEIYLNHCKDPDIVYVSCIFKENKPNQEWIHQIYPNADIYFGGTGINNDTLPLHIEVLPPDYDLYPSTYSQGYTTRGCIKNCPWCIVKKKEGKFRRVQHVKVFHDDRFDTVMIMDNNWLADKDWFFKNTDYILENKLKVIEQGMDIQLVDDEIAQRLSELTFAKKMMKFAFDQPKYEKQIIQGIETLKNAGVNIRQNVMFYVLTGYNTTPEEDLYRCNLLKKNGTNSFVMQYHKTSFSKRLAKWANRNWFYWKCDFPEFNKHKVLN